MTGPELRLKAFLSGRTEVFHSIQHRHEIWRHDPFDVEEVHVKARTEFERLLTRATTPPGTDSGRILLLLGDSGCGKTHLIRAFRALTHERSLGFVGYMQMTTATSNYGRYVLSNLIDSLDQPYNEPLQQGSGLMRLSTALLSRCEDVLSLMIRDDPDMQDEQVHELIVKSADDLIQRPQYENVEVDLLRALLYLQRADARIKSRVLKYLRCEDLSGPDRRILGDIIPRVHDDDPQRMVEQLGRLMRSLDHSLVLCVDQLEDMYNFDESVRPFQKAMSTLCDLADRVPSSIIVISSLHDFWRQMKPKLSQSIRDRIEKDPEPVVLESRRTKDEARDIVARRLAYLYECEGGEFDATDPTHPLPSEGFNALDGLRTRDVLNECHVYRALAIAEQRLPAQFPLSAPQNEAASTLPEQKTLQFDQLWNDLRSVIPGKLPESEVELSELLSWALAASSEELRTGHRIQTRTQQGAIEVDITPGDERLLVIVCNRQPQGGHLTKQLAGAQQQAARAKRKAVVIRTTTFPTSKTAATELGKLVREGGRRAVLEDSECRTLLAMQEFRRKHKDTPGFAAWLRDSQPMTQMSAIREILDLDHLRIAERPAAPPMVPAQESVGTAPARPTASAGAHTSAAPVPATITNGPQLLRIGKTRGMRAEPVVLFPEELTQHMALLGGSGSGKTTAALNVIEQLLLNGIPVILLDRKGDLAGYARSDFWTRAVTDERVVQRLEQLRARIDVALFTPGHPGGRPLAIPLVPDGLHHLPEFDRQQATEQAAAALGDMLDYKPSGRDKKCRVILAQALDLLVVATPDQKPSLERLIEFIEEQDPLLLGKIGRLDPNLLNKLVEDLETLKLGESKFLAPSGERLDMDLLLGRGNHTRAGRTRLSIVSTKFLGDTSRVLFWVSQLLIEVTRWTSQNPAPSLQAAILFDEADLYLPATRQPATKLPMENLLKRARSAGLGLMLATQSPGDLDYKCRDTIRTWLVGRVKETTALNKMKPMLSEARGDVASKIPGQSTGEFHLLRDGQSIALESDASALVTEQLSEDELLLMARRTLGQG